MWGDLRVVAAMPRDGFRVVAARLWLIVDVDVGSGFEGCFGIGLLVLLRDVFEYGFWFLVVV